MKKFKKILKEGNSKKIKKFVQKKMDKIKMLERRLEYLGDYAYNLEQNYYELEKEMSLAIEPEKNPEEMVEETNCCKEKCCKE